MAFVFPDPSELQAVTNPTTGVNYVWKEDLGKWVVASQTSALSDAIWEGTSPPPADQQDDYQLWYNTETLELYFRYCDENAVCAWVPTYKPISALDDLTDEVNAAGADIAVVKRNLIEVEDDIFGLKGKVEGIQDGLGKVTLEEVLTNGNVSDKGIVLTNAENDALLLSPDEARIMVGGIGENVIPRLELRHETGIQDTSIVKLELDEDGERFDIECDEKVNNIHFRFNDESKLDINKKGDAVFNGKVKVAEATRSDEVPTLGQVTAVTDLLQLELDQITGSYERGAWNHDDGDGIAQGTEYILKGVQTEESFDKAKEPLTEAYNQCLQDADGDTSLMTQCNRDYDAAVDQLPKVGTTYNTNDWNIVNKVIFSPTDLDGTLHSFADVEVGQTLDMYCDDGSGFMVARINKVTTGMWYEDKTLEVTPLKTTGIANGKTRVKIFTLDDTVDADALDAYVKKSGDEMTGRLTLNKQLWIKPEGSSTGGWGPGNMLIVNQQDSEGGSIARFKKNGTDLLKILYDGPTSLEKNRLINVAEPELNTDGATKKYVDNQIEASAACLGRKFKPTTKWDNVGSSGGEVLFAL